MKYFVDTNIIIDFLNKDPVTTEKLIKIVQDENSELFINRLVYLESLRTIPIKNSRIFRESKAALDMFTTVDINHDIYDQAIELSRYCQSKGITLKGGCAAIDFVHFTTAKYYELEMLANDGDMEKLADIYPAFLSSKS